MERTNFKHRSESILDSDTKGFITKEEKDIIAENKTKIKGIESKENFINTIPNASTKAAFWIEEI